MEKRDIKVVEKEATAADLEGFDAIIIATGATGVRLPVPGADRANVQLAVDALAKDCAGISGNIVVVGGGLIGTETAVQLSFSKENHVTMVEMLPQVRFYEAGLGVRDSLTARDYWCFLNKLRHKSSENEAFLRKKFLNFAQEKKYLADALTFFKAHGLYTKE